MNPSSSQQRAIITGASSGIGRATALAFANVGIDVALVSRSAETLEVVAQQARQKGVKAAIYPLDLRDLAQVKDRISEIAENFAGIDILVTSAGVGYTNLLRDTSLEDWQQVIDLNLTSVFQCIQGVLPQMRDRGSGTIVNIASIAAKTPFPNWGVYSVSKVGMVALSQVLAAEERANGIRITTVFPGAVNTPIWDTDTVKADFDRSAMLTPDIIARAIVQIVQLPAEAVIEEMIVMPSAGTL